MKLYRYEKTGHCYRDYDVILKSFDVCRKTKKCYVIYHKMRDKFVRKQGKSLFAYPTKEKALENFIKRTETHISYLENNIIRAKVALQKAKKIKDSIIFPNSEK